MSLTSQKSVSANEQIQNLRKQVQTTDQEKEQLRSEIWKLKEASTQAEFLKQKVIAAETKISVLQQTNSSMTQQINNLTNQNAKLLNELTNLRAQNMFSNKNDDAIKNKLVTAEAQLTCNSQENQIYANEIKQLRTKMIEMQERHKQEIVARDDLISKLRYSSLQTQNGKNLNLIDQQDQQIILQKYTKKKNELELLKQQMESNEEKSRQKLKKTKKQLEETQKKFHLLKKKYVVQKEDFSNLQSSFQKMVSKTEAASHEQMYRFTPTNNNLPNSYQNNNIPFNFKDNYQNLNNNNYNNGNNINNNINDCRGSEIAMLTMEKQRMHEQLIQAEEKLAQERDNSQEMRVRLEKAEGELTQLRCFLKILANNERNLKRMGLDNENIIDQIETLGIKLDQLGKIESQPPKRKPMMKKKPALGKKQRINQQRPVPLWKKFQEY